MTDKSVVEVIRKEISCLEDPRILGRCDHSLFDIVVLTLCGVIAGCEGWESIVLHAKDRKEWFSQFLVLENGIPHATTLSRVFERICPDSFQQVLQATASALRSAFEGKRIVSIDGKALRHSFDKSIGQNHIHIVSAYDGGSGVTIGQVSTACKSNEITAIPKLLELIDISGAVVTLDAMGCQKEIVRKIVAQGGDYIISLKGNQSTLHDQVKGFFSDTTMEDLEQRPGSSILYTVEKGHGRVEERAYAIVNDVAWIDGRSKWENLNSIGMVISRRTINGKISEEKRHFIASIEPDVALFEKGVRGHWSIENSSHYVLDVSFREDDSRIRRDYSPENMAIFRRLAVALLQNENSTKRSIKQKSRLAFRDDQYLEQVLRINPN
jgi:predicted transposase YbfD/YdcC